MKFRNVCRTNHLRLGKNHNWQVNFRCIIYQAENWDFLALQLTRANFTLLLLCFVCTTPSITSIQIQISIRVKLASRVVCKHIDFLLLSLFSMATLKTKLGSSGSYTGWAIKVGTFYGRNWTNKYYSDCLKIKCHI